MVHALGQESLCRDSQTADVVAFDSEPATQAMMAKRLTYAIGERWVPDFGYGSDNPISVLQLVHASSAAL